MTEKTNHVIESTQDLRAFLIEQMNAVANGETDPASTKGVTNLAQQIYNTLNIEIKTAATLAKIGDTEIKPVKFK